MSKIMKCRHCYSELKFEFADLHLSPPCENVLRSEDLDKKETYYPLKVFVCENCLLVQIAEEVDASEIFNGEYSYFSSYSTSWLRHAKKYVHMIVDRLRLSKDTLVLEIASNDGYLLQYFKDFDIPVLGIEPSVKTAEVAINKGIESIIGFFGQQFSQSQLVDKNKKADLIIGNNVLAHVPDINDFVSGMKLALKEKGTITMEFPHLLKLIEQCQFDTIYHEHYSYLSLLTARKIFNWAGLEIYDVEEIPSHGGSLRIYGRHIENNELKVSDNVLRLIDVETKAGFTNLHFYQGFQERIDKIKYDFLEFLMEQRKAGKKVIAYGAAGKGNALLNYCGIKGTDLIQFVVDANPHKQNTFLPGSHIPVVSEKRIKMYKPDYVIILPWNLKNEIVAQINYISDWNGKFVTAIPEVEVLEYKMSI